MIRDTSAQDRPMSKPAASGSRKLAYVAGAAVALLVASWVAPGLARMLSTGSSISLERLRIAEVKRGNLTRDVSAQGRIVAAVSPTLYAPAVGTVTLTVQAGDKVDKDQIVATLDSPELTNKLAQEQSSLQSVELDAERAGIDHRKQQLTTQKAVDQADIDRQTAAREVERTEKAFKLGALPNLDVLRAGDSLRKADIVLSHAKKDAVLEGESLNFELKTRRLTRDRQRLLVAELQRQVDALKLRAPVSGQIGQLLVQQKSNVPLNAPLLTVVDLSAMELEVPVPETFAHDLAIGMPAEIVSGNDKFPGELSAVSPEVVNGQVVARVRFSGNKPEGLRQNQRLTTRILIDEHPNVLMVERGPFVDSGAGRVAYIVHDGIAERRAITLGATSLNAVELVSGVKEGDRLVISATDDFKGAERVSLAR
ncbi:MAG: HlyD family efflux transporter periplasmic adaptor subunit [Tahibacter sp.]